MKNRLGSKEVSIVSMVRDDKPTSFFLVGKNNLKQTPKQKIQKFLYDVRKKRIAKSLKANPHSMEQVADYIVTELGFSEVDKTKAEYKTEYFQMRASFILQYKPELLGDLAEAPKLENHEEETIELFMEQIEQRQKAAENIPPDIFDIDLHIYEKGDGNNQTRITVEKNYGYIGGSASGSKNGFMRKFDKTFRKVYQYYGVTQKDIDNNTKRYIELVKTLARR